MCSAIRLRTAEWGTRRMGSGGVAAREMAPGDCTARPAACRLAPGACGEGAAGLTGAAGLAAAAFSTSCTVIRPPCPEPRISDGSSECSDISRRTAGLIR